jgi:prevent-host-death family protein
MQQLPGHIHVAGGVLESLLLIECVARLMHIRRIWSASFHRFHMNEPSELSGPPRHIRRQESRPADCRKCRRLAGRLERMKTVPLTEAKDKLSALVDEADTTHEIIQITRHGRVAAVIMSADDLDSLNETLHALRTVASE